MINILLREFLWHFLDCLLFSFSFLVILLSMRREFSFGSGFSTSLFVMDLLFRPFPDWTFLSYIFLFHVLGYFCNLKISNYDI
jgi:hypothetical protein